MMYYIYPTDKDLQHHGVKGMKWGVRRYQNYDGTQIDKKNSKEKPKMTKEQKKDLIKKIAVGSAIALAVGALAYTAYTEIGRNFIDKTIKPGTPIQTIVSENSYNKFGKLNTRNRIYGVVDVKDKNIYKGLYSDKLIKKDKGKILAVTSKSNKGIKIASRNSAAETFKDLYKNDPEFKNLLTEQIKDTKVYDKNHPLRSLLKKDVKNNFARGNISDMHLKGNAYELFNIQLTENDARTNKLSKKFYDALKTKGYDGILDVNDHLWSGYGTNDPYIIFNTKNLNESSKKLLNQKSINLAKTRLIGMTVGEVSGLVAGGVAVNEGRKILKQEKGDKKK